VEQAVIIELPTMSLTMYEMETRIKNLEFLVLGLSISSNNEVAPEKPTNFRQLTPYAIDIAESVNIQEVFRFNHHCVGEDMNGPSDRFSKGRLNELAFVQFSEGRFEHVDEQGYDLVDNKTGKKVELKFSISCLKTPTGPLRESGCLGTIRIKNTMGVSTSENPTLKLKNRADYYIFVDKTACAMAEYKDIEPFLVSKKDVIVLEKMPMHKLCLLADVSEEQIAITQTCPKYIDRRKEMETKLFEDWKAPKVM